MRHDGKRAIVKLGADGTCSDQRWSECGHPVQLALICKSLQQTATSWAGSPPRLEDSAAVGSADEVLPYQLPYYMGMLDIGTKYNVVQRRTKKTEKDKEDRQQDHGNSYRLSDFHDPFFMGIPYNQ